MTTSKTQDTPTTQESTASTQAADTTSTTQESDGVCTILRYQKVGNTWIPIYDPTDPDCKK